MISRWFLLAAALTATQPPSRDARWREDVAVARDDFLVRDLSYTPARRALARQRLDRLAAAVPTLTDQQIVAELARVAALADNAHTRAYLLRNRGWWRRYPVRLWKFADGWRVVAVRPGAEALLGGRVIRIGGRSIAEVERAVAPLHAGPATWAGYMASYTLTSPDALLGTGMIRGDGAAAIDVRQGRRTVSATLAPVAEPRRQAAEESWWFLSPAHPATRGWVQVLGSRPLPAYLGEASTWYGLRRCAGGILYLQFSRAEDQPGRAPLDAFGQQVLAELAGTPAARLIVDLRFNTGGNLRKTIDLFRRLADSPTGQRRGQLFVILGPSTFSAGITPAAVLRERSRATFVGSAPGDRLRFWAEGGNVTLPHSGLVMHYADRAHLYDRDDPAIARSLVYLRLNAGRLTPDRPALTSFAAYLAGRDPAAERIVRGGLACAAGQSRRAASTSSTGTPSRTG